MKIGEGNLCPQFKHFIVMLFVAASGAGSPDMISPVDPESAGRESVILRRITFELTGILRRRAIGRE